MRVLVAPPRGGHVLKPVDDGHPGAVLRVAPPRGGHVLKQDVANERQEK